MDQRAKRTLHFFSKRDCPLCDKAWPVAEAVARRHALGILRIDIESDPDLLERHRERIPVLELAGETLGWGLLSERAIERKLSRRER